MNAVTKGVIEEEWSMRNMVVSVSTNTGHDVLDF
jgi:hypothetical protein